jgi:glycosyltransferase involved in cell wall biosynthesis
MKLSVAMITYNQERYIGQAIESVLAQEVNFRYEIVIGEDCSTDRTRSVILDFQRRYPERIVPILRERNIGAMRNFAETIAACRGQYVAFLEGDDYWTSADKLRKQVEFLDAHPDRVLCCHRVNFLNEINPVEFYVYPPRAAGPYTVEDLLRANFVMTCSTMLRRDLISPLPRWFFTLKMGDWPLFAMVARHGKIELMDEIMANYRVHPGGMWSSLPPINQRQEMARMLGTLDKHFRFQYTHTIQRAIARICLDPAVLARSNGRRIETARYLVCYVRNGGLRSRETWRLVVGLTAYVLIGSVYKIFSRAKTANDQRGEGV